VRELRAHVRVEVLEAQAPRLDALDVVVERVDEHPEREVAIEVRARASQDDVAARLGASSELGKQPRLADAGLPDDLHRARPSRARGVKPAVELRQLRFASYEVIGEIEDEGLVATIRATEQLRVAP
jgi:hypothetical protein